MGIKEKLIERSVTKAIPKLVEVLESLHGFTRLNAMLLEQLLIEAKKQNNSLQKYDDIKTEVDALMEAFTKAIEET